MAAVKGVNVIKNEAGAFGDNWVDQEFAGETKFYSDSYEAAALAGASTIQLTPSGLLVSGSRVKQIVLYFDALGGSTTASLGDSTAAARYLAASATDTAGRLVSDEVDGFDYVIGTATDDDVILLTTANAMTGTLKWKVEYA